MKKKLNGLHIIVPTIAIFLASASGTSGVAYAAAPAPQAVPQPPAPVPTQDAGDVALDGGGQYVLPIVHELSAQDLSDMGITLQASADPSTHPRSVATLNGRLFSACLNKFPLQINQPSSADGSAVGFEISEPQYDSGKPDQTLESCQKDLRRKGYNCNLISCTSVSSLDGASLDLSQMGVVKVGLFHVDLNSDSSDPVFENIGDEMDHNDAGTLAAMKKAAAAQRKQDEIDALTAQSIHCVKDQDQLAVATDACDLLQRMLHVSDDDVAAKIAQCDPVKLEKEKLIVLKKDIAKVNVGDPDAVQAIQDEINQFASDNPDQADAASSAYLALMNKYLSKPNASASDIAAAQALATAAGNVDGVSAGQSSVVQGDQNQIQYLGLAQQAGSSSFSPISFFPAVQALGQTAIQSYQSACQGGSQTQGQPNQACQQSYQFLQQVSALPQQAMAQQQQQQQVNSQLQQQIAQAESSFGGQTQAMSSGLAQQGNGIRVGNGF